MRVLLHNGWYETSSGVATIDGEEAQLTSLERRLLNHLVERPGALVPYTELLTDVWGAPPHASVRPVESALARVRKRLGESGRSPVHLHTDYGEGLRFVPHTEPPVVASAGGAEVSTDAALPLGTSPLPPRQAVAWLRRHARLEVPLARLVEKVGGSPVVLQQVADLGPVLTTSTVQALDADAMTIDGHSISERLASSYGVLDADERRCLHQLAAFAPPLEAAVLAQLEGRPILSVLGTLATLVEAGWVWRADAGFGVDALATRWLEEQPDHEDARLRHLTFLGEQRGGTWRWHADIVKVRRRDGQPVMLTTPGQRWYVHSLGGDLADALDAEILRCYDAMMTGSLREGVARFQAIAPPSSPDVRFRWVLVGTELAVHSGDLDWMGDLIEVGEASVHAGSAGGRFQFHLQRLEHAQLRQEELDPLHRAAASAARVCGQPERTWIVEVLLMHYRFQRTPSVSIHDRLVALAHEGSHYPFAAMLRGRVLAAARELSLPATFDLPTVAEELDHRRGYIEYLAELWLSLAVASLPDLEEAERMLYAAPTSFEHAENHLRQALLEKVLHGRSEPLERIGGQAMCDRVDALRAGDSDALSGPGWQVLRHALRIG